MGRHTGGVSSCDGCPAFRVDVEHLPGRRLRLWLREATGSTSLGELERSTGRYPVVHDRVREHLGLGASDFYVELRVPRPAWIRIGDRVTVIDEDGRRIAGTVADWIQGEVLVDTRDHHSSGMGLYSLDDVLLTDEPAR